METRISKSLSRNLLSPTAFSIYLFIIYVCYLPFSGYTDLPFDAKEYWVASTTFIKNNVFSIAHFKADLRGVNLPLLYFPFSWISEKYNITPILFTRLTGAIQAATLFGLILPKLWEAITDSKEITWIRRALFACIGSFLWKGYFNFSLSDFPAILAISLALLIIFKKENLGFIVLAGIILAFGVNFRPVYKLLIPVLILALWTGNNYRNWKLKSFFKTLCFIAGFLIGCIPQIIVNTENGNSGLFASSKYRGHNLLITQLNWGLNMQKYETSLLVGQEGPLRFREPVGNAILAEQNMYYINTFQEYFNLFKKYPLDFAGIYFRHLFNGLDLQYSSPYPLAPFKIYWGIVILNFSVLFTAFAIILRKLPTFDLTYKKTISLLAVILPCLAALPLAIECRFLLPLHLFFYALVCFNFPNLNTLKEVKFATITRIAILYIIFMAGCLTMSTNAQAQLELKPRLYKK